MPSVIMQKSQAYPYLERLALYDYCVMAVYMSLKIIEQHVFYHYNIDALCKSIK